MFTWTDFVDVFSFFFFFFFFFLKSHVFFHQPFFGSSCLSSWPRYSAFDFFFFLFFPPPPGPGHFISMSLVHLFYLSVPPEPPLYSIFLPATIWCNPYTLKSCKHVIWSFGISCFPWRKKNSKVHDHFYCHILWPKCCKHNGPRSLPFVWELHCLEQTVIIILMVDQYKQRAHGSFLLLL